LVFQPKLYARFQGFHGGDDSDVLLG
jgi:hypothetical protein